MYGGHCAALRLKIIVAGADLGDLSAAHMLTHTGHRITLLNSATVVGDVGTGIHVSPSATRNLHHWGLGPALAAVALEPTAIVFRRSDTGCARRAHMLGRTHGPGPRVPILPHPPRGLPRLAHPSRAWPLACASASAPLYTMCGLISVIWPSRVGRASRSLRLRCYRRPEAALICQVDAKRTLHGPQTLAEHVGAPQGSSGSPGRRVPSGARMPLLNCQLSWP